MSLSVDKVLLTISDNDFKDLIRTSSRQNTVLLLVKREDVSRFYALEIDN